MLKLNMMFCPRLFINNLAVYHYTAIVVGTAVGIIVVYHFKHDICWTKRVNDNINVLDTSSFYFCL